ncbi:hypothetical protein [Enterococcus faecium]|uniref:hypothetical protein n=1 Tax=Enterococcus faecium TaxID=1352 RepID=UPI0033912B7E
MKWMAVNKIEELIINLRGLRISHEHGKQNDLVLQDELFKKYLPDFMNEIKKQREKGIVIFNSSEDLYEIIASLMEIEARIISIIYVAVYEYFEKNYTPDFYIQKNELYVFDDYLNNISYYAQELESVSSLAKFYDTHLA